MSGLVGHIGLLMTTGVAATGPNAWSTTDKSPDPAWSLSESNVRCQATANPGDGTADMIRSLYSRGSGKQYIEFDIISVGSASVGVGLATSLASLTAVTDSVAGHGHVLYRSDSAFFDASFGTGGAGFTFAAGNVVAFAIDFTAKTVKAYKGNVLQNTWTWTPTISALYVWMSCNASGAETRMLPSAAVQHYSPPAGYSAWD